MQWMWDNIVFVWYNKFYNKKLVATSLDQFFRVLERVGPVFKSLVAVPKYLNLSRPVEVASCLAFGGKNWTYLDSKTLPSHDLNIWARIFNPKMFLEDGVHLDIWKEFEMGIFVILFIGKSLVNTLLSKWLKNVTSLANLKYPTGYWIIEILTQRRPLRCMFMLLLR